MLAGRDESGRLVCHPHCLDMTRALRHQLIATRDVSVRTKDGREVWLSISTVVVPSPWRDMFVLVHLFREVSHQKEMERFVHQLLSSLSMFSFSNSKGSDPLIRPTLPPTSSNLTHREREVLRLLASGASTKAIAKQLFITPATARNHIQNILARLGVHSRLEAVTLSMKKGLI